MVHQPSVSAPQLVVDYTPDTWDDADLEPVMAWLEDHLRSRRGNHPRPLP